MAIAVNIPEHLRKKPIEKSGQNKQKGWSTPYGFADFSKPVTYEYACSFMKEQQERFAKLFEGEKE